MKGGEVKMNISKKDSGGIVIIPQTLPGCGDAAQVNCSGSECNSLNNK